MRRIIHSGIAFGGHVMRVCRVSYLWVCVGAHFIDQQGNIANANSNAIRFSDADDLMFDAFV